jgi:ribonucleoside-triphosphate reductase (thioredoxin)
MRSGVMDSSIALKPAQEFVFYRTYSRWSEALQRRETWPEAVDRYFAFMKKTFNGDIPAKVWTETQRLVLSMDTMPSMRALAAAGPALEGNHIIGYNCCSMVFKDLQSLVELFYILMCGVGVGFSVEQEFISQIPVVERFRNYHLGTHVVGDSREGWALSLKAGLEAWFSGHDLDFDYTKVRPKGARLKTMGGRASGPEPLKKLHDFVREKVLNAQGRRLSSIEWLDIGNMIGEVVVVGGVRRSSEISFSDIEDKEMRDAKHFPFPKYRYMSNNAAVYHAKPDVITFLREWTALAASGTGERGIFNLEAARKASSRRKPSTFFRTNPCGEIILRADTGEFCNLTEVVVRAGDKFDDLREKVKAAVWLGSMQACLTNFPFLRPSFKATCEEERLLGVSLTGQMDNSKLLSPERLDDLKDLAILTAKKAAKALGTNVSVAITTGKPSGTVSQLVNCASGCHARRAKYYIRRYRISATDALYKMMKAQGVVFTPENGQGPKDVETKRQELLAAGRSTEEVRVLVQDWTEESVMTWVASFPEAAPKGAVTQDQISAIEQLEWYLKLKRHWCEHNQSITVYVREDEWLKVASWVYDHFDDIIGVSFLPYDGGKYEQAPYEDITKEQYESLVANFPKIDYSQLSAFEQEDNTTGLGQAVACSADGCELK